MLAKKLLHRDTSRDYKSRAITVSVPFITKRRLSVLTVTLCFYGERLLWLSLQFDRYNTPNMLKCCFQTQSRFHDRATVHNLSVSKENDLTVTVFGIFSAAYNWEMLTYSMEYGEIWKITLQSWDRPRHQQNALILWPCQRQGLFPTSLQWARAMGWGCSAIIPWLYCLLKCRKPCNTKKNIQGWSMRACWQS